MNALLHAEEVARWQQARENLLRMIEIVDLRIRLERRKRAPFHTKGACLEAQRAFLADARYELAITDEEAISAALEGRVIFRERQVCFYQPGASSIAPRSIARSCPDVCKPKQWSKCQLSRAGSVKPPCIDTGNRLTVPTSP